MKASDALLTEREAAELIGIKRNSLAVWRMKGHGPDYIKFDTEGGRGHVRYERAAVERWVEAARARAQQIKVEKAARVLARKLAREMNGTAA